MSMIGLKLVTGEDVIGEDVSNTETSFYQIKNPISIVLFRDEKGNPQPQFMPFPLHSDKAKDYEAAFSVQHVVYTYVPAEQFVTAHEGIFGVGLVVPPKKLILG